MAEMIFPDDIDFSLYERETEVQAKVKPASLWVQELIDQIRNPVRMPRAVMPWRKTHAMVAFRPGEVTVWGGANGNGKSLNRAGCAELDSARPQGVHCQLRDEAEQNAGTDGPPVQRVQPRRPGFRWEQGGPRPAGQDLPGL